MRSHLGFLITILACAIFSLPAAAQCPQRPVPGTVVQDPLNLSSSGGTLNVALTMQRSVDNAGYTHYCYEYNTGSGIVEAPTLRVNPGDHLLLNVINRISGGTASGPAAHMSHMAAAPGAPVCGDGGEMTVDSTNVHFHGMNIPPRCHQDDVINTLIQPGTAGFQYDIQIPANEPPGLYWYHPHVHGFTEYQVNGGAAGAIVVEGMEKIHPEVAGLTERILVIRQQFVVPWIPGPYQLTTDYVVASYPNFPPPVIQMKPNEKQFWRVVNATNQDFLPIQMHFNGKAQPLQVIALDGYPVAPLRFQNTILLPPASRAEFIVQAPSDDSVSAQFVTQTYLTGPTGNPDTFQILGNVQLTKGGGAQKAASRQPLSPTLSTKDLKFAGLESATPTATRSLFFSEEFGGTGGPIQFYITVNGQKQRVFQADEKPVIVTNTGAVEDWTIENRALETHAFHIHQIHFLLTAVDGKPIVDPAMRDTVEIPYWEGPGHPYHNVTVRMDFRDPTTAGTYVFHCHILLHEDLGMMHKIEVLPAP